MAGWREYRGHVLEVIKYFETMTAALERGGEGGRPVRVAVSLRSPEIRWIWGRDKDVAMGGGGAGSGKAGAGAVAGGAGPWEHGLEDVAIKEGTQSAINFCGKQKEA